MAEKTYHMKVPSTTETLHKVREFVSEAAHTCGFDEESMNKISIAVDEACTNIIKHAYNYSPNYVIDLKITMSDSKFEVIITHWGKSFDSEVIKQPDMKEYLTHYRKGGLGIHLMRSLMDKVEYIILTDRSNEVHLVKYLPMKVSR